MKHRAQAFHELERYLAEHPTVEAALLGPASRTWYKDLPHIEEIVEYLAELGVGIRIAGKLPFDRYVETFADNIGVEAMVYGPVELQERLRLPERSAELLEGAGFVVAFPEEGQGASSADPLVEVAIDMDLPILALYRSGAADWVTRATYIYAG